MQGGMEFKRNLEAADCAVPSFYSERFLSAFFLAFEAKTVFLFISIVIIFQIVGRESVFALSLYRFINADPFQLQKARPYPQFIQQSNISVSPFFAQAFLLDNVGK